MQKSIKKSFTLAETLVVLMIIGVIGSLTIPSLIKNYNERQTVVKLKKFYSEINQAFQMASINKGKIERYNAKNNKDFFQFFKPYLKIIKECEGDNTNCFYGSHITLNKRNWGGNSHATNNSGYRAILSDGVAIMFNFQSSDCSGVNGTSNRLSHICAKLYVDLNGLKNPNQIGVDTFVFRITTYGIYPMGLPDDSAILSRFCSKNSTDTYNGEACSSWVIMKENMDYLKKDISW